MAGRQHITQYHVADMPRQCLLTLFGKQAVAEDERKGLGVRNVEEGQRADLPVQFQRIDAIAEDAAFLAAQQLTLSMHRWPVG